MKADLVWSNTERDAYGAGWTFRLGIADGMGWDGMGMRWDLWESESGTGR